MNRIKVYHFHNGNGGGVLSVIKNLLKYSSNPSIENHIIHTINKDVVKVYPIKNIEGAATERIFYYSARWNFYYTCKELSKLIPHKNVVIVSHDWLELGMASQLGLQNRVISFLHGDYDYYYQLAKLHEASIDRFIAISNSIAIKLKTSLSAREKDIHYLRFPVPSAGGFAKDEKSNNIIFIGRLTEEKGYHLLPVIDNLLRMKSIFMNWHIVGDNNTSNSCRANWDDNSSVRLHGSLDNEEVLLILQRMNYFILPSVKEGMPVSLIEAMKAGVIPLVNNIEGGIQELVIDSITGFKITENEPGIYADCIAALIQNAGLSKTITLNCMEKANALFDPYINTRLIEAEICNTFSAPLKGKTAKRTYGSRLDQEWLPNVITKTIRNFK